MSWFPWQAASSTAKSAGYPAASSTSGTASSAASPSSAAAIRARHPPHPSRVFQEEDDEAVEHLLTQFPAYGSSSQASGHHAGGGQSNPLHPLQGVSSLASTLDAYGSFFGFLQHKPGTADDGGGNSEAANSGQSRYAEDLLEDHGDGILFSPTVDYRQQPNGLASQEPPAPLSAPLPDDWDVQEQMLWKTQPTVVSATFRSKFEPQSDGNEMRNEQKEVRYSSRSNRRRLSRRTLSSVSPYNPNDAANKPTSSSTIIREPVPSTPQPRKEALGNPSLQGWSSWPSTSITLDDRNHWMPDQLCKQCYSCEVPFTVFRRRHHCRLCGQVFCNACSAYFVPQRSATAIYSTRTASASSSSSSSVASPVASASGGQQTVMIRVCQFCNDQFLKQQQLLQQSMEDGSGGKSTLVFQPTSPAFFDPEAVAQKPQPGREGDSTSPLSPEFTPQQAPHRSTAHLPRSSRDSASSIGADAAPSAPIQAQVQQGVQFTGRCAASHLEMVTRELLRLHAPLAWDASGTDRAWRSNGAWVNKLLSLATRCCATVDPDVKRRGDMLDLRPYVKVKTIPGGKMSDCAYLSGIVFRKTPRHKAMCREILNPRVMVLSGGIDFHSTRSAEQQQYRLASLETLFEQEDAYLEILVSKILKHQPNVLFVGRGVSGKGQDLLIKAGIVLVQYVKPTLLHRIARQTGATIISSADHLSMMAAGSSGGESSASSSSADVVVGRCHRFRLVTFRDNEVWVDVEEDENGQGVGAGNARRASAVSPGESSALHDDSNQDRGRKQQPDAKSRRRSIHVMLGDSSLSNHERQLALAASRLGQGALEGAAAMSMGLASRFVARNYIMLEGCPKHLGCTIVLRGSHRAALKQVKVVFRFLVNMAYNLKLETTYFRERSIRIRPDFELQPKFACSTSLCVDYGSPATTGKRIRPWNGGNDTVPRLDSGDFTAFDHQAILVTSVWMTDRTQCCPAEIKGIVYYSIQDVSLGQFLRDSCFNLSLRCQNPNCKKSVLDHSLSFVHNDGLLKITVEELEEEIPPKQRRPHESKEAVERGDDEEADRPIATWTYCSRCKKVVSPLSYLSDTTWKYSFGKFLEVFFYNRDAIMNAPAYQCSCQVQSSTQLYFGCGNLAARFDYEPIRPFGVFVRRILPSGAAFQKTEAMRRLELISGESTRLFARFDKHLDRVSREARSLFNSPVNRPEHLQTVLSELNSIGADVDETAKTLQDKIAAAMDSCRQQSDSEVMNSVLFQFPWSTRRFIFMLTSAWNERLSASGQAIVAMKKIAASSSRTDGVIGQTVGDPLNDSLQECMKRLRKLNDQYTKYKASDITQVLPSFPGDSDLQQDGDYDDEFDDPDSSIDFADGVDADVLASRRRLQSRSASAGSSTNSTPTRPKPIKSLGTRRHEAPRTESVVPTPKPTTGGAVKSAITRFFNRGGRDRDPYTVDLGVFAEGRPRLVPGVNGLVVPICDEQLSSVIAYSLTSVEYAKQFKYYSRNENTAASTLDGDAPSTIKTLPASSLGIERTTEGLEPHHVLPGQQSDPSTPSSPMPSSRVLENENNDIERRMLMRSKSHIKHTYRDFDEKGQVTCKFVCTTYWATQFHAVRQVFLSRSSGKPDATTGDSAEPSEIEQSYVESLSTTSLWDASGGKSGASFSKSCDGRFVIKCISRTELQMFLDCAPAYFEYLSKAFFHGLPTVLCKIVGVYQIGIHNRLTGKRTMEQVAVMANIFHDRKITRVFDLKGSLRGRFAAQIHGATASKDDLNIAQSPPETPSSNTLESVSGQTSRKNQSEWTTEALNGETGELNDERASDYTPREQGLRTLLDGDFLAFTEGRPMPLTDRAKAIFQMSILNDTLFLSIINVLDYSILVGVDEENMELVVGIIDFMRQYDIMKQMERVGKSLPMVVGSEAPTIIQPPLYKARFTNAMERYFMTVPSKWTAI